MNRFRLKIGAALMLAVLGYLVSLGVVSRPDREITGVTPTANPTAAEFAKANAELVELHNAERSRAGLAGLAPDGRLASAALGQARDCAGRDLLTHTGSDGSDCGTRIARAGYGFTRCAENAARQPQAPPGWPGGDVRTPGRAMAGWMDSPGHRANVLGPYARMGAGWADSADGTRYWVVDFASP